MWRSRFWARNSSWVAKSISFSGSTSCVFHLQRPFWKCEHLPQQISDQKARAWVQPKWSLAWNYHLDTGLYSNIKCHQWRINFFRVKFPTSCKTAIKSFQLWILSQFYVNNILKSSTKMPLLKMSSKFIKNFCSKSTSSAQKTNKNKLCLDSSMNLKLNDINHSNVSYFSGKQCLSWQIYKKLAWAS